MTIRRGKTNEYLRMTIDFTTPGCVKITMYDFIKKLLMKAPKEMRGKKATAAPEYLFKTIDSDAQLLNEKEKKIFHTLTATLLYLSQRGIPDLQLATAFLCTRVKPPNEYDWKKLTHPVKYLDGTSHLPLVLSTKDKATTIYIDGAHAVVHTDMKGHVGLYANEGRGAMYSSSSKIKLNTTSSTGETEIVSIGEKLPKSLWFRLFQIAQTGNVNEHTLMQDNQSAMLLENNGRFSVGKGSRHIDI